jgi:integral membrane protein
MAWATGIWLIALCCEVVLKYIVQVEDPPSGIGVIHSWVDFIYLLATVNLAVKVRWPFWTTIGTLLAGTIPLLGVILEHFRTRQVNEKFDL